MPGDLNINPDELRWKCDVGCGGHSRANIDNIKGGRLIGVDQDEDAKEAG